MANKEVLDDPHMNEGEPNYTGKMAGVAWKIEQAEERIRIGRTILYVLAGLIGFSGFLAFLRGEELVYLLPNFVLFVIYLGCAYFSIQQPLLAFSIALICYLGITFLNAFFAPESLFQGIIWKIVIVTFLGTGLYYAYQGRQLRNQLRSGS